MIKDRYGNIIYQRELVEARCKEHLQENLNREFPHEEDALNEQPPARLRIEERLVDREAGGGESCVRAEEL